MSVATFRRKVVPPPSGRLILFHADAKDEGMKGLNLQTLHQYAAQTMFETQFVIIHCLKVDSAFMGVYGWLLVF
jgi:hypothetical protein